MLFESLKGLTLNKGIDGGDGERGGKIDGVPADSSDAPASLGRENRAGCSLFVGSLEWVRTLLQFTEERLQAGQPVLRLILILAIVAGVTLISAFAFQTQTLKKAYGLKTKERVERPGGQPLP